MDYEIAGVVLALLLWALWAVATERKHRRLEEQGRLPPGPRPWPVVGNMFQLTAGNSWAPPHQLFAKLADKHGPIMTLHLGSMTTVVISSRDAARVMFKQHDAVLAGRKIYESMKGEIGNEGSLITAQYGHHWRTLRRLCTAEFFAAGPLDAMRGVREKCVDRMVKYIAAAAAAAAAASGGFGGVDVGRFFFLMAFNLIGNLIFSKDLLDPRSERGARFFYHAGKTMEYAGKPNFLEERMREMENGSGFEKKERKDYLDVLLEYKGDGDGVDGNAGFSSTIINVIVFEMFTAGTDTTTSTLEWAMAELLHNPETLHKAQSELRAQIKPGKKLEEQNLDQLPYLKAVIKETLRLHPPLPFLVPHKAMDSCKFLGFHIPKETQILVNVWAIGRDPKTWKDPLRFRPERFLDPDMADYKGQHFEFIPFGSGRRMCPAVPLAGRVLPLALGSVLYSFDWALAHGLKPEEMDMSERMGITLRKGVPLKAVPVPYVCV
ncbi:hypothetical protein DH2020_039944 [Rehmannia glutinosa]|uniref:Cytochrome P450 n=1 Tax=Rehmannia glutinosa TaxID=99300 RepID=A0ABR0UVH8_REHGL